MKYPPVCSAHWEGAVGQWLRNQLDARGIDAPAYGRYVLSLLTRPLDPADLSPSPIGSKMWERRSQSDWPPVKIEALKRSAAVQCLINASDDQNSGIEQLVDELCLKLKEVEEGKAQTGRKELQSAKNSRRDRSRPISPSEMARMYYAAFPALVPSTSAPAVEPTSVTQQPPSTSTLLNGSQRTKDTFTYKCGGAVGNKECSRTKKIGSKERRNTIHTHRSHYRGNNKNKNFYPKSLDQTEALPEWVNDGDVWDIETQDHHLPDYVKSAVIDDNFDAHDNAYDIPSTKRLYERDADIYANFDDNDFLFSKHCPTVENAKFPQPLEEESMAKFKAKFDSSLEALWPKEQNNNIDYELPMDLNDISSPSDRMFDCYSADKPLPLSLTSSIWSNNESKLEWENNDLVIIGDDLQPRRFVPEMNELNIVSEKQNNLWPTDTELYNKESMEVIYNKLKPLNLDDSDESPCDLKKNRWCTAPQINWLNNNTIYKPNSFSLDSHPPIGTPARSFNILNHNSSYSSFTEVLPKAPTGYIGDNLRKNNVHTKLDLPNAINNSEDEKEDEDLLTSMKTHFRPIKHDAKDCAIVNYADGMTFPVVSDLDHVKFNRSSSGTIFLESETDPPKQYMEYRKQGIDYARLDIGPSSVCSDEGLQQTDLVLKFRVCQTEKAIQTDIRDMIAKASENELNLNENLAKCEKSSKTETTATCLERNHDTDNELEALNYNWVQCEECKLNNNQWISNNWHPVKVNSSKIWSLDDNFCKACSEQQMKMKKNGNNIGKNKMYEEESDRDWDDILSDLKYIRDNDWQDDLKTPSENCYIAPSEISYQAIDGNFIKSALMLEKTESSVIDDVKAWLANTVEKTEINTVGRILDQSLIMYSNVEPHCDACADDAAKSQDSEGGWRMDRKRRHSAVNGGRIKGAGKLRCTLPAPALTHAPLALHLPFLPTTDRPLTR